MKVPAAPGIRPVRTGKNKSRPQVRRGRGKTKNSPLPFHGTLPAGEGTADHSLVLPRRSGSGSPSADPTQTGGKRELVRAGRASVKTRDSYA
jgi:hypothetical protein